MVPVTVYTRNGCPYCTAALSLLAKKGAKVTEYNASTNPANRADMRRKSRRTTFRQLFIGSIHAGGCDDIHGRESRGERYRNLAGT